MLTIETLKKIEPNSIFRHGTGYIEHPWFNDAKNNLEDDGRSVKVNWVAVRGGIHDWTIYHSLDANFEKADYLDGFDHLDASIEDIAERGAKLTKEEDIKRFVPCDDEAFQMYRY